MPFSHGVKVLVRNEGLGWLLREMCDRTRLFFFSCQKYFVTRFHFSSLLANHTSNNFLKFWAMLPHWTFLPWRTKKSSVTVVLLTFSLASVYEGWLRTWVWPGSADQRAKPSSEPLSWFGLMEHIEPSERDYLTFSRLSAVCFTVLC